MAPKTDYTDRVKHLIAENLGINLEEVRNDADLMEDLGADSMDITELAMAMEKEFDIELPDEDLEEISTVQDCIELINDRA